MSKIDLSSIKKSNNKVIPSVPKQIAEVIQKPIEAIQKPPIQPKQPKQKYAKPIKPIQEKVTTEKMSDLERNKKIKLLDLYVAEFPDELKKYSNVKFDKCSDQQLLDHKNNFDRDLNSTSNLSVGVSVSQQALKIYEELGSFVGLEIKGISKLGYDETWIKNIKAVCLKYMDGGINIIEPEHQLLFMLIQNSLALHYLNTSTVNKKTMIQQDASYTEVPKKSPIEMKLELNQINGSYSDI